MAVSLSYIINMINGVSGPANQAGRDLAKLTAQFQDLSKQNATPVVELQDKTFKTKITDAKASIAELSKRIADPSAKLQDKTFKLGIADAQMKLDRLTAKVAKPEIDLKGLHTAELGILKLSAELDKLDARRVNVKVGLSRLGGVAGAGGILAGGAGALSMAGPLAGLGAGIAAFGALAIPTITRINEQVKKLQAAELAYNSATTKAAKTAAKQRLDAVKQGLSGQDMALASSMEKIKATFKSFGEELVPLINSVVSFANTVLKDAGPAITGLAQSGAGMIAEFLVPLDKLLKTPFFARFIHQMQVFGVQAARLAGGQLVQLLKVFMQLFIETMPAGMKILNALLPAFVQLLGALTPTIVVLSDLTAGFLNWLNQRHLIIPFLGLLAAGIIAVTAAMDVNPIFLMISALAVLIAAVTWTAKHWKQVWGEIKKITGPSAHEVAVIFDGMRHEIAHVWDQIFENSVGMVIRLGHNIETQFNSLRHGIAHVWDDIAGAFGAGVHRILSVADGFKHVLAVIFDNITSLISSVWRQFWRSTVGNAVKAGFDKVTNIIDHFRHWIAGAFDDIRHAVSAAWDWLWDHTIGRLINAYNRLMSATAGFRHDIASWFDRIRHDIAAVWDTIWNNTVGREIRGFGRLMDLFGGFRHDVASWFDRFRHGIATIWDTIWNNTVGRVKRGIGDVGRVLWGLKGAFATPINWVINHILDPMVSIWDTIVGAVGQKNLQFHIPNVHFAEGGKVTGGKPGRDSVMAVLMPGEVVVPTSMVNAGAVDHLRGRLPGFAHGGKVGQRGPGETVNPRFGPIPGVAGVIHDIAGWIGKGVNWVISHAFGGLTALLGHIPGAAGVAHLEAGMARTLIADAAKGIVHALTSFAGPGGKFGAAGPGGGAPAANAALARRMFPGEDFAAWNYVAMRESGWNQFAMNPSSGAYGIPQALPFTKMPRAAWPASAGGSSNPAAQISWMEGYMRSRYGGAAGAAAHERAFSWYGSGLRDGLFTRPTIIGVGERGPERVNVTPAAAPRGRPGPLVHVENMNVRGPEDISLTARKLSFEIMASSFG